jgi:hypothetical protein
VVSITVVEDGNVGIEIETKIVGIIPITSNDDNNRGSNPKH